ncbi:MAG: hypothetical protein HC939_11435 [Pleurocapsa sp. SU_5_0]|nr:hypothetical protein [Pleurocapsa sp. SU_5_0]
MKSSTEELVDAFLSRKLPQKEWTHEAHLKVGLWHLLHYDPNESLERLRQNIKQYNVACGIENIDTQGYHETITRFYVWLINKFLQQTERSQPIDLLANRLISLYGNKSFPLNYYSRDKSMSKTSRLQWVEPDLKPLVSVVFNID